MTRLTTLRRWRRYAALVTIALVSSAHLGVNDSFFIGEAGPYHVQVTLRAPEVIPGRGRIIVRTSDASIRRVTTQAARWDVGTRGSPPPDEAVRTPGDSAYWSSQAWFMVSGAYALIVRLEGGKGAGSVTVPFDAVASHRLTMEPKLGWVLGGLGLFLILGMTTFAGAAARDATLAPGLPVDARRKRQGRVAMLAGLAVMVLAVTGGRRWWGNVNTTFDERGRFTPVTAIGTTRTDSAGTVLRIAIDQTEWKTRREAPIIRDHGKLVHLFLASNNRKLDAFAHLHPVQVDSGVFETRTGPLPAGDYVFYVDIVQENGFSQVLWNHVVLPPPPADARIALADSDDAVLVALPDSSTVYTLPNGETVTWERAPGVVIGEREMMLRFHVRDRAGKPVAIEPFLGMNGHAVISKDDNSVLAHLHPVGSVSMAAIAALEAIERGDTLPSLRPGVPRPRLDTATSMASMPGMSGMHAMHAGPPVSDLEFPFSFARAGKYAVWVQFRLHGQIQTAAFRFTVPLSQ